MVTKPSGTPDPGQERPQPHSPDGELPRPAPASRLSAAAGLCARNNGQAGGLISLRVLVAWGGHETGFRRGRRGAGGWRVGAAAAGLASVLPASPWPRRAGPACLAGRADVQRRPVRWSCGRPAWLVRQGWACAARVAVSFLGPRARWL